MDIVAIDPGLDGGICILRGRVVQTFVAPTLGTGKRSYDVAEMRRILHDHISVLTGAQAFLERAQAMPGQGVSSMFSVGFGFGLWQGLLAGLRIPVEIVSPQSWQREMFKGLPKGDTKASSALIAQRLRPDVDWRKSPRCRKSHDGITDAFCIGEYGRRLLAQRGQFAEVVT
jgi:crossover junction endodeoxyribonuclease RuvC